MSEFFSEGRPNEWEETGDAFSLFVMDGLWRLDIVSSEGRRLDRDLGWLPGGGGRRLGVAGKFY